MSEPRGRALPRRFGVVLAGVPLVAVLLFDAALVARRARPAETGTAGAPRAPHSSTVTQARAAQVRADAIHALLARRSHAVLHHDRAEWMSTVDAQQPSFRRSQARAFTNLRSVPFASWGYGFDETRPLVPNRRTTRYHAPVYAPADFFLRYRLRGFDPEPTSLPQYPTFVRRGDAWYLASLSDFDDEGLRTSRDLWDFGRVVVARGPNVLVLGHPQSRATMQALVLEVEADIPRVSAVWGRHWTRRAVLVVPRTQRELARVVDDYGNLDHIAAVATAEVQTQPGRPRPVGNRIGINPRNWPKLSPLGRQIVLTHELTHVATRGVTGAATPTWLAEGMADYVGYLDSGIPTTFAAQELAHDVRAGHVPRALPVDDDFDGGSKRLSQAYEGAWMACRLIALRYGQATLVRLYRTVGTSQESSKIAVATAIPDVLHVSGDVLVKQWRAFLRAELG